MLRWLYKAFARRSNSPRKMAFKSASVGSVDEIIFVPAAGRNEAGSLEQDGTGQTARSPDQSLKYAQGALVNSHELVAAGRSVYFKNHFDSVDGSKSEGEDFTTTVDTLREMWKQLPTEEKLKYAAQSTNFQKLQMKGRRLKRKSRGKAGSTIDGGQFIPIEVPVHAPARASSFTTFVEAQLKVANGKSSREQRDRVPLSRKLKKIAHHWNATSKQCKQRFEVEAVARGKVEEAEFDAALAAFVQNKH